MSRLEYMFIGASRASDDRPSPHFPHEVPSPTHLPTLPIHPSIHPFIHSPPPPLKQQPRRLPPLPFTTPHPPFPSIHPSIHPFTLLNSLVDHFLPFLRRLAERDWFTTRMSATALFRHAYR